MAQARLIADHRFCCERNNRKTRFQDCLPRGIEAAANPDREFSATQRTNGVTMAPISMRQLPDHAAEYGYGVPAFNVNNLEQMRAIMKRLPRPIAR